MAKKDIEVVMSEIKTIFLNNLNSYISAINTEKNDGLALPALAASGANYYDWEFEEIPHYSEFFLQELASDNPTILSNGPDNALLYSIRVIVFFTIDAKGNRPKRKARYNRVIKDIIKDKLYKVYSSELIRVDSALGQTAEGAVYEIAASTFTVAIVD